MATISEPTKRRTHADNLLSFAADMGWLTAQGTRLTSEDLNGGMQSLSALSSVILQYPRLAAVRYRNTDIDGFIDALQAASSAYSVDCILTFAADSGILSDGAGHPLSGSAFAGGVDALLALGKVVIDDEGETTCDVHDQVAVSRFINRLRAHLPVIEVIDLVDIALDCGIITDLTEPHRAFMAYKRGGNYYSALCYAAPGEEDAQNRIFRFQLADQSASASEFYVTFDAQKNDIRHETEYASRASVFIDTLMKLVMAKYNVLIVHKAAMETDLQIPDLPIADGYTVERKEGDDAPTESTQSQLKVLIRYKDTAQRTAFTANVIDDIFITFDEDDNPRWGFSKITPGQSEPTPEPIQFGETPEERARAAKELHNVRLVKKLSEDRDAKYTIFEKLRHNEDSNLYKLIKQREEIYRRSAASGIPKVEFSLTPLTIYSNHIVSRTLQYHVVGKNPKVSIEYEYQFDPLSPRAASHSVTVNGKSYALADDNRLVMLLQEGDPAGSVKCIPGCASIAVRLSDVNPTHYPKAVYGDVYYLKEKCVPASATGYTGLPETALFYEDDLAPSSLSSAGVKYLHRDMIEMPVGSRYFKDGDPALKIVAAGERKYVPKTCAGHTCPTCGTAYYAANDMWETIADRYKLTNGGHCCPACVGHVLKKGGAQIGVYALKNGENTVYCVDDPVTPRHIHVCTQCRDEGKAGLLFADSDDTALHCSVCGEVVCDEHRTVRGGKVVCHLCLSAGTRPAMPLDARGGTPDMVWRKVRANFPLSSRKSLEYSLHGRWLRVFRVKDGLAQKIYIFVAEKKGASLSEQKFVFMKAKSLKKQ